MSGRTPFRSHLLQQWANGRRPPVAVVPWLHNNNGNNNNNSGATTATVNAADTSTSTATAAPASSFSSVTHRDVALDVQNLSTPIERFSPQQQQQRHHHQPQHQQQSPNGRHPTSITSRCHEVATSTSATTTTTTTVVRVGGRNLVPPSHPRLSNVLLPFSTLSPPVVRTEAAEAASSSIKESASSSSIQTSAVSTKQQQHPSMSSSMTTSSFNTSWTGPIVGINLVGGSSASTYNGRNHRIIRKDNGSLSQDRIGTHGHTHGRVHRTAFFSTAQDGSSDGGLSSLSSSSSSSSTWKGDHYDDDDDDDDNEEEDYNGKSFKGEHGEQKGKVGGNDQAKESNIIDPSHFSHSEAMQSLLMSRRTASRLEFTSVHIPPLGANQNDIAQQQQQEAEEATILDAIHRAVITAQMAPNHKRTEPFTFLRFPSSSNAAQQLAEIAYQVTLRKGAANNNSSSELVAEKKRDKWAHIPAFLVSLVHENQWSAVPDGMESNDDDQYDPFEAIEYMPPNTERQLEDYASACAAIQNILLSLHAERIATKWATGRIIHTRAFRTLVGAGPTDRVAGLIMVGGINSTDFANPREEYLTQIRRHRRRPVLGDLLTDLP